MILDFLKTLFRIVFSKNKLLVSTEIKKERLMICKACAQYNEDYDFCGICYCKMKVKTGLTESKCPQNLW